MFNFTKVRQFFGLLSFRRVRVDFYRRLADSIVFTEQLRQFLIAEYAIATAKATKDTSAALAYSIMLRQLKTGKDITLAQMLRIVMPKSDRLMLAALNDVAEERRPQLLRKIATTIEFQAELRSIIKKAVLSPLMLFPGVLALAYVIATQSIPVVIKVAPESVWTPFNYAVRVFAGGFVNYGAFVLLGIVLATMLLSYQLPRWTGRIRAMFEQVHPNKALLLFPVAPWIFPLVLYRDFQAGLLLSSISIMLSTGKSLTECFIDMQKVGTPWVCWHINRIQSHLTKHPNDYQGAFSKGLLSPQLMARLSSRLRTSTDFSVALIEIGSDGTRIKESVETSAALFNLILLVLGLGLGVFMLMGQNSIGLTMSQEMSPHKQMQRQLIKNQSK